MPEKTFSWNDAALVWWFITWRSAAVMLILTLAASYLATYTNISILVADLLDWSLVIIGVALQIFLIKIAVNRTYRDFKGPTFRLQVVAASQSPTAVTHQVTEPSATQN